jgi:hypothetical protein
VNKKAMLAMAGAILALTPAWRLWHRLDRATSVALAPDERPARAQNAAADGDAWRIFEIPPLPKEIAVRSDERAPERFAAREEKPASNAQGMDSAAPIQLWQRWETLLSRSEYQQIPIVGALLAENLRRRPDEAIYRDIAELLNRSELSIEQKSILIDLLGEIATPAALAQLIGLAREGADSPLYIPALNVISRIGDNRWDGRFHEELAADLDAVWTNLDIDDQAFLAAVAKTMAAIGAPASLDLLLRAVADPGQDKDAKDKNRLKQTIAFAALPKVRNPAATDALKTWLLQEPLGTAAFEASGLALANVGSPDATQTLLEWAETAPPDGARRVADWLARIHDTASLELLAASRDSIAFDSDEVKAAFVATLGQIEERRAASTNAADIDTAAIAKTGAEALRLNLE